MVWRMGVKIIIIIMYNKGIKGLHAVIASMNREQDCKAGYLGSYIAVLRMQVLN